MIVRQEILNTLQETSDLLQNKLNFKMEDLSELAQKITETDFTPNKEQSFLDEIQQIIIGDSKVKIPHSSFSFRKKIFSILENLLTKVFL